MNRRTRGPADRPRLPLLPRLPSPLAWWRRAGFPLRAPSTPAGVAPLEAPERLGVRYPTGWARTPVARAVRAVAVEAVARPLAAALADPEVTGLDRLDGLEGPVVLAANHLSHADTAVLVPSLPARWRHRVVVGAAADYFFDTRPKAALAALVIGAIPVERQKINRRSAEQAAELIDDGWSLLLYPEGGRSPDGWARPFRGGAAWLAIRCGVPVVPVHLDGTDRVLPPDQRIPRRSHVRVTFGRPVVPQPGEDARALAARLQQAVAELADEAATDWWSARLRAHAGTTPPITGPGDDTWRRAWQRGERSPRARRARRAWPDLG